MSLHSVSLCAWLSLVSANVDAGPARTLHGHRLLTTRRVRDGETSAAQSLGGGRAPQSQTVGGQHPRSGRKSKRVASCLGRAVEDAGQRSPIHASSSAGARQDGARFCESGSHPRDHGQTSSSDAVLTRVRHDAAVTGQHRAFFTRPGKIHRRPCRTDLGTISRVKRYRVAVCT